MAILGILSPLAVSFAFVLYIVWMLCNRGAADSTSWGVAMGSAVVLYFLGIGTAFTFLVGLGLHGVVAVRTQRPCRWAWWFSLVLCLLCMLAIRPIGTVAGGLVAALLLAAKPFRIMRRGVEPASYSAPLADTEMPKEETDLVAKHLEELKAFRNTRIAARFEVVANRSWLRNLFAANETWIEIRWIDDERLQLDLVALKPSSLMPVAWERKSGSTWLIPMAEASGLVEWINREWVHARGTTNKTLRMWTE